MHHRKHILFIVLMLMIVGSVVIFLWRQKRASNLLDIWSILPERTLWFARLSDAVMFQQCCTFPFSKMKTGLGLDSMLLRRICESVAVLEQWFDLRSTQIFMICAGELEKPDFFLVFDAGQSVRWQTFQECVEAIAKKTGMQFTAHPDELRAELFTAQDTIFINLLQNLFIGATHRRQADIFARRTNQSTIGKIVQISDSLKNVKDNHLCEIFVFRFRGLLHQYVPEIFLNAGNNVDDTVVLVMEMKQKDMLSLRLVYAKEQKLFNAHLDRRETTFLNLFRPEFAFYRHIRLPDGHENNLLENIFDSIGLHILLDPLMSGGVTAEAFIFRLLNEQRFMQNLERLTMQEMTFGFLGYEQSVYMLRPNVARLFSNADVSDCFLIISDSLGIVTSNREVIIQFIQRQLLFEKHDQNMFMPILQVVQSYPYFIMYDNQKIQSFYTSGFSDFHYLQSWYADDEGFMFYIKVDSVSLRTYFTIIARQWLVLAEAILSRVEQLWTESARWVKREKDGFATVWAKDSSYYVAGQVRSGKKDGVWRMYDSVGRFMMFQEFKDGKGYGQCGVYMYIPGQRFFLTCAMQDGKIKSNVMLFYSDGKPACVIPFGLYGAEGVAKVYYRTGSLMCELDCQSRQILSAYNIEGDLIIGQGTYDPRRMLRNYELLR